MNRVGYVLAGAAFLVQAPRLVLTILAADRLLVEIETERLLLSIAAVGTAVVLTGGGMFLAHAALTAPRWRLALGIAWVLVLTASAGLVAPAIAAGLADAKLHEVVSAPAVRTAWALLASIAHELTAAGCMLAAAASSRRESVEDLELRLYAEKDAALAVCEREAALARSEREVALNKAELAERELSELHELVSSVASVLQGDLSELAGSSEQFPCEGCGRSFASKPARSGHQRSCPGHAVNPTPPEAT